MPSKKRFNSRFPPARIKKIMQTDEDIGKVAAPVPVLISRALELFLEQILTKTSQVVQARSAKTLSRSHIKHAVMHESQFDFLKDLVAEIEDVPELEPPKPDNGVTRRYRKRKAKDSVDKDSKDLVENSDSSPTEEEESSPTHGRKDYMLPVVVSVEDEHSTVSKDSDSVASLAVPIATPMASPNTSALVINDAIVSQTVVDGEDDDYDS